MNVLVNGIGNIGTTLLGVLHHFKKLLRINKIYALKNTHNAWNKTELSLLESKGIIILRPNHVEAPYPPVSSISESLDYIFDCTAQGMGIKNKQLYLTFPNLKGCSAQGSEYGFGVQYMSGINDQCILSERFVQIVSCNTHGIVRLIHWATHNDLSNLEDADFVVVRRCEDIGYHQRLVSANVVSRHLDSLFGTHHAMDALKLYNSLGQNPSIRSSDITTPSQLLHAVRFSITLKHMSNFEFVSQTFDDPYLAHTHKFDSNVIFDLGRRYGFMGRIYAQAVLLDNNILINNNNLTGWAFIPQEGCTILSTIHSYLLQCNYKDHSEIINFIKRELIRKEW